MNSPKDKIIAIVGPTGSGKSALAVDLALAFSAKGGPASGWNGAEIISADSRQVYKGLDVSSGKITKKEMKGVPHHLLDVADPAKPEPFTLAEYLKLARQNIADIRRRQKLPFIVGGTGLFVTALLEGYRVPEVPPNPELRNRLEALTLLQLQKTYKRLDPEGFKKIDQKNPRRLIRAIEVVASTGRPFFDQQSKNTTTFARKSEQLIIGLEHPWEELKQKIRVRLFARIREGMLEEIKRLHKMGVSWERLESFGLEQKWMVRIARDKVNEKEALEELLKEEIAYAKRQLTWWRKRNVRWVNGYEEAKEEVIRFLGS